MERVPGNQSSKWLIEPRYTTIQFVAKVPFLFKVKGELSDVSGFIVRDDLELASASVEARIRTDTLNSGNRKRDLHLMSPSFLDVPKHADLTYVSNTVARGRDRDTLRVSGVLTIRGMSREIVLDVTEVERSLSPQGDEVAYYSAQAEFDRHDFGVNGWRFLISPKVRVNIHVQAVRQAST